MIATQELERIIFDYKNECKTNNRRVSKRGLAERMKCTTQTVININNGFFNGGLKYTDKPSATRIIANSDFELVQELYKNDP